MNLFAKVAFVSATLLSVGALTACQSVTKPHDPTMQNDLKGPYHHHHRPRLSDEDMAKRKAVFEQFQQACNNQAVGAKVQVKLADQTISGTCELRFKPDHRPDRPLPPSAPTNMPAPANK